MTSRTARFARLSLGGILLAGGCATFQEVQHPQPGEITVSSANYVGQSDKQLRSAINDTASVNPKLTPLKPLAQPQFFLYAQGEFDQSDLSYNQILHLLTPALAAKDYIEASSAFRNGRDPLKRVDLVLRVNCGERAWRDPIVRTTNLTWDDGLVALQTLHLTDSSGNSVVWDYHAGGDDAGLAAVEQAIGAASSGSGGGGGGSNLAKSRGSSLGMPRTANKSYNQGLNDTNNPAGGLSQELTSMPTQDFFLVVVEAFDAKELMQKRGKTVRLWETFIALPKKGNETFAQVLPAMLKLGAPYFGETTQGLAVFNDDRAKVEVGAPYVVPDAGNSPAPATGPSPTAPHP